MPQLPIADKPTLDEINTKAGNNTDAAGTTTIFARLKQIYDYLSTHWTSTRAGKLDLVGVTNPTANTTTIMGYLRKIFDALPTSPIKSIQRGQGTYTGNADIPISAVDLTKSMVIMNSSTGDSGNTYSLCLVNSTTLRFAKIGTGSTPLAWEVIEYV